MAIKQKLAELIVDIKAKLDPLKGHLAKANAMMKRGLASMVKMARRAGKWIAVGLVAALAWATRAAMKQEDAEISLAAALRQTGDATKENIDRLKKYAAELQELTKYGDEEILAQMAFAKNLGVSTGQLQEAAKAAIGLAASYKLELATAMMLVGRASTGQTQMLTRYGIVLDASLSPQEKFIKLLEIGAHNFALAEAEAESTKNSLVRLWNVISDVAEKIAEPLLPRIKSAAKAIREWAKDNEALITAKFGVWLDATGKAVVILAKGVEQLLKHWRLLAAVAGAVVWWKFSGMVFKIATGLRLMVNASRAYTAMRYARTLADLTRLGGKTRELAAATVAATKATKAYAVASTAAAGAIAAAWAAVIVASGIAVYMIGGAAIEAWKAVKKAIAAEKRIGKAFYMSTKERLAALRKERDERVKKMKADGVFARWAAEGEAKRKKAAADLAELDRAAAVADKDQLQARLAFLEKIGGKYRDIAKLKRQLLELEAEETSEATGLDPLEIRRALTKKVIALQRAADKDASDERRAEYRDKLQTLKILFTGEARFAKDLAMIKKRLRREEALDIKKVAPWLDTDTIKEMLRAKETPVEIARAGLVGIQAAWGQIATGTQRTQEEQLRALEGIRQSVERQEELAEAGQGMSIAGTPRY